MGYSSGFSVGSNSIQSIQESCDSLSASVLWRRNVPLVGLCNLSSKHVTSLSGKHSHDDTPQRVSCTSSQSSGVFTFNSYFFKVISYQETMLNVPFMLLWRVHSYSSDAGASNGTVRNCVPLCEPLKYVDP